MHSHAEACFTCIKSVFKMIKKMLILLTLLIAGILSDGSVCVQSTQAFGESPAIINNKGVMVDSGLLIVEEYHLILAKIGRPSMSREFREKYFSDAILNKRSAWRKYSFQKKITAWNNKLAAFGYGLELPVDKKWRNTCDLYKANTLLLPNIRPRKVEVNESKTGFALAAENTPNEKPHYILIQKNHIQSYDQSRHGYLDPVFLEDRLLAVEWDEKREFNGKGMPLPRNYHVKWGHDIIYTGKACIGPVEPFRTLLVHKGQWILEVMNRVIINGEILNQNLYCDKIFHYRLLKGEPFYFFEKEEKTGISYDEKVLPVAYDKVLRSGCCENPGIASNENMVWFYGLKDGVWHYVEIGIYK